MLRCSCKPTVAARAKQAAGGQCCHCQSAQTSVTSVHTCAGQLLTQAHSEFVQFQQAKADGEVRWAVLNTVSMLRRHAAAHDRLAAAMEAGKPIADCIALLEDEVAHCDDI
jgi:hypothetical protein